MSQFIHDNFFLVCILGAIFAELYVEAGFLFWWGKPKGPDFSNLIYEYWFNPKLNFISKLGIFLTHALKMYIILLLMGLFSGYIKWPF